VYKRQLLPYFITVANGADRDQELVTRGNEAVIRARYADAAYFVREDRKKPLEAFNDGLATLTFQEQLGSMLDKVRRLERLAPVVAQRLGLSPEETASATRAAVLSKADLATDMVVEMTSLQGVMGEIYALDSGEPPAVARAIREHYVVRPEDEPLSPAGLALNLSNRLDSLSGLFAVGLAPTSSADPFGLRRDALALVQNLMAAGRSFDVVAGLRAAGDLQPVPVGDDVIAETAAFVARRLYGVLRDEGYAHDVVEAALAQQGHDPARAARAVEALAQVVADPAWMDVLTAYARCKRIVRGLDVRYPLAPQRYIEQATRDLHAAYKSVAPQVASSGQVSVLYEALQALVDPINRFFDDVLVMTEDPLLREARLALVQHIAALPDGIVDLSLMQGF
jgi:glycyl-tRNA synthetase